MTAPSDNTAIPRTPRAVRAPRQLEPFGDEHDPLELDTVLVESESLVGAELMEAAWDVAAFRHVSLQGAGLTRALLADVAFDECDLATCDLLHASLTRASITGGRANGIGLVAARLRDVVVRDTAFDLARMRGATLTRCRFDTCGLRDADLSECVFTDVAFEGCDFTGADLTRTTFERCSIMACTLDDVRGVTQLRGVTIGHADAMGAGPMLAAALGARVEDLQLAPPVD